MRLHRSPAPSICRAYLSLSLHMGSSPVDRPPNQMKTGGECDKDPWRSVKVINEPRVLSVLIPFRPAGIEFAVGVEVAHRKPRRRIRRSRARGKAELEGVRGSRSRLHSIINYITWISDSSGSLTLSLSPICISFSFHLPPTNPRGRSKPAEGERKRKEAWMSRSWGSCRIWQHNVTA